MQCSHCLCGFTGAVQKNRTTSAATRNEAKGIVKNWLRCALESAKMDSDTVHGQHENVGYKWS